MRPRLAHQHELQVRGAPAQRGDRSEGQVHPAPRLQRPELEQVGSREREPPADVRASLAARRGELRAVHAVAGQVDALAGTLQRSAIASATQREPVTTAAARRAPRGTRRRIGFSEGLENHSGCSSTRHVVDRHGDRAARRQRRVVEREVEHGVAARGRALQVPEHPRQRPPRPRRHHDFEFGVGVRHRGAACEQPLQVAADARPRRQQGLAVNPDPKRTAHARPLTAPRSTAVARDAPRPPLRLHDHDSSRARGSLGQPLDNTSRTERSDPDEVPAQAVPQAGGPSLRPEFPSVALLQDATFTSALRTGLSLEGLRTYMLTVRAQGSLKVDHARFQLSHACQQVGVHVQVQGFVHRARPSRAASVG